MPTLYCPECGYNLTGLTENRCPECGEAFDLQALEGLLKHTISARSAVWQLVLAPLGFALIVSALLLIVTRIKWVDDARGVIVGIAAMMIVAVFLQTLPLAQKVVRARHSRRGRMNTSRLFRSVLPCWVLFTLAELILTVFIIIGCFTVINAIGAGA